MRSLFPHIPDSCIASNSREQQTSLDHELNNDKPQHKSMSKSMPNHKSQNKQNNGCAHSEYACPAPGLLRGFVTKVSTSPALVAILQTCLARTRTFKRFREESFHLTGFAGKNTSTPNLAILMQKMNVDASFVTDSLLQAHAELSHSSNSHTRNLSRPQVGSMTKL